MVRTAKNEALSLRDMILRWCDPVLVSAVQAAEAPFTRGQVEAACPCSLGGAAPGVSDPGDLAPDAIDRIRPCFTLSWNSLYADLRSRIMISRIQLVGVPLQAGAEAPAKPIPPSYVDQYTFHFAANCVKWYRGNWRAVTASLSTEASYLDDVIDQPLALWKAMLTWCDDVLVDRYENAVMADRLATEIRAGRLHPDRARRYAGISMFDIDRVERPWRDRLKPAREELEADFRARLAGCDIELRGLQTRPVLAKERSQLSPAWAERMEFGWQYQSVKVEGTVFLDVVGIRPDAKITEQVPAADQPRRRGRPAFPMDKLVNIARTRLGLREISNKSEARILLTKFRLQHPSDKPPGVRTIVGHVKEIYAAAGKESDTL